MNDLHNAIGHPYFYETLAPVSDEARIAISVYHPSEKKDNVTVVFLSGYRDDQNNIKCTTARETALASGASFVAFDYRGHGRSQGPVRNESLDTYWADSRIALQHTVAPEEKLIIIGHSIGVINGIYLADEIEQKTPNRVEGIIGLAPVPALMDAGRLGDRIYQTRGGREELERTGQMTNYYAPQLVYAREFCSNFLDRSLVQERNHPMLRRIKANTCFIVSDKDAFSPKDDIHAVFNEITSARVIVCKGAKHTMDDPLSLEIMSDAIRETIRHSVSRQHLIPG